MKIIKIDECFGCPYCGMTNSYRYGSQIFCKFNNNNKVVGLMKAFYELPIPDWCPLEEDVTTGCEGCQCFDCKTKSECDTCNECSLNYESNKVTKPYCNIKEEGEM
jgi:hypothetical protein